MMNRRDLWRALERRGRNRSADDILAGASAELDRARVVGSAYVADGADTARRQRRFTPLLAAAAAFTLVIGAGSVVALFSSSGDADMDSGGLTPTSTPTSIPVVSTDGEAPDSEGPSSPDSANGVETAAVQEGIDWHWTRENERAACMAERGFEYIPYVSQRTIDEMEAIYGDPVQDTRTIDEMLDADGEYFDTLFPMDSTPLSRKQMEDLRESMAQTGWRAILGRSPVAPPADDLSMGEEDPNTALRLQMKDTSEWDGYWRAFQGWTGDERADGTATEEDTYNSCMSIADREAGPEPVTPTQELYQQVYSQADRNRMAEFGRRITVLVDSDPRMAAAAEATNQCLLDLGYGTTNLEKYMYDLVHDELRAAGVEDPFFRGVASYEERERLHIEALGAERFAELQSLESTLASATVDCGIPRSAVHREVIRDHERQILEKNPDLIELLTRW